MTGSIKNSFDSSYDSTTRSGYIQFQDGTMICYGIEWDYPSNPQQWGQSLYYAQFPNINFPKTFVNAPGINLCPASSGYSCMIMTAAASTTQITNIELARPNTFPPGLAAISWIAIGRWKS